VRCVDVWICLLETVCVYMSIALLYAQHGESSHLKCRSLQVLRALQTPLSLQHLFVFTAALSSYVSVTHLITYTH